MKYYLGCIFLFIFISFVYSQSISNRSSIWYFGNKAGLDFKTEPPTPIKGNLVTYEGCSSISDEYGNLLFYTDGVTIYNKNHDVMDNGNNLKGDPSCTQSSVVARLPGIANENIYYVFTVEYAMYDNKSHYSIVDMSLNGGKGKVIQKNTLLVGDMRILSEKIATTLHENEEDVWIILHGAKNKADIRAGITTFKIFLLTETGLIPKEMNTRDLKITKFNYLHTSPQYFDKRGYFKFSTNGDKLAMCIPNIRIRGKGFGPNPYFYITRAYIMDFHKSRGDISNIRLIDQLDINGAERNTGFYGVEFSFDDRFVYLTRRYHQLIQYDLSLATMDQVRANKVLIGDKNSGFASIQKAINGKIYIAKATCQPSLVPLNCPTYQGEPYIAEIKYPERKTNIGLNENAIKVDYSYEGLPQFINDYLRPAKFNVYSNFCEKEEFKFVFKEKIEPDSYFQWDLGDGTVIDTKDPKDKTIYHNYKKGGNYNVYITYVNTKSKRIVMKKTIFVKSRPDIDLSYLPKEICKEDLPYVLSSKFNGYFEVNGVKTDSITDKYKTGEYKVTFKYQGGCKFDKDYNIYVNNETYNLGKDIKICFSSKATIGTSQKFDSYQWSTGQKTQKIIVDEYGEYTACVKNRKCVYCDTIKVDKYFPKVDVETIPRGFKLNVKNGDNPYMFSINGKNYSKNNLFNDLDVGRYKFFVKDNNGCIVETDYYNRKDFIVPKFFSPNGDGINDIFTIEGIDRYPKAIIEIYDRYGNIMAKYYGEDRGWDGRDTKGNQVPLTDYWYVINYDGNIYKGNLSVIK